MDTTSLLGCALNIQQPELLYLGVVSAGYSPTKTPAHEYLHMNPASFILHLPDKI
jgi:hypothetical protein